MEKVDRNKSSPILVVEDSHADCEAIFRAFKKLDMKNPVYHCESGEKALDYLYRRKEYTDEESSPRPGVILLDLNLPGTDGREVLKVVKGDPELKSIPIVVLTTSDSEKDIKECYQYGANSYMTKPANWEDFFKAIESFKTYCLGTVILPAVEAQ